jgi:hypothetical protein
MMNRSFLTLALLGVGVVFFQASQQPVLGEPISHEEAQLVFGAACYNNDGATKLYCYMGNCSSGGCGCSSNKRLIDGTYKAANAQKCASSEACTAVFSVSNQTCTSS